MVVFAAAACFTVFLRDAIALRRRRYSLRDLVALFHSTLYALPAECSAEVGRQKSLSSNPLKVVSIHLGLCVASFHRSKDHHSWHVDLLRLIDHCHKYGECDNPETSTQESAFSF
jgi:hypothetical protein